MAWIPGSEPGTNGGLRALLLIAPRDGRTRSQALPTSLRRTWRSGFSVLGTWQFLKQNRHVYGMASDSGAHKYRYREGLLFAPVAPSNHRPHDH